MKTTPADIGLTRSWQPVTLVLIFGACALTVLLRMKLLDLPWNLTPVGALALFAGARLRSWQAYLLPPLLMTLTNALLVIYPGVQFWYPELPVVYGCLMLNVLLGRLLTHTENPWAVGGVALACSLQFFVVTNFAAWLANVYFYPADQRMYEANLGGLWTSYVMGLPFYRGTFAGDMLFTVALFSAHALLAPAGFPRERVPGFVSAAPGTMSRPTTEEIQEARR
jgi:hypothetical protein